MLKAGRWGLVALAFAFMPGPPASAQWATEEPILMLETGMHLTRINRIDIDAGQRVLITGSHDKTARIWDAATGEQLQVLRLPVGAGLEGQVRAVALSPDGTTAAVSGWTFYDRPDEASIFFFEVGSGRMSGRVDGMDSAVNDLEFSPDGRYLAVATADPDDLAILDVETMEVVRRLSGYEEASYNVAWAPDGRLATGSYDGWVRLYDRDMRLVHAVQPEGGPAIFGLAFSPDGEELAVGMTDTARIQVFDGHSLGLIFDPDTSDVTLPGDVAKPAWSPDGALLVAGAGDSHWYGDAWYYYVRVWEDAGRGAYKDLGVAADTVLDVKFGADGNIFVGSARPDLTLMDTDGNFIWWQDPANSLFSAIDRSHFRVSADARVVGAGPMDGEPFIFDLAARRIIDAQSKHPAPLESAGGLAFTDWVVSRAPKLNGRVINFGDYAETTTGVSVAADGSFALLASEWNFLGFNADASLRYEISSPSVPWAVNVSAEGEIFVAAHGDGTFRWYRTEDGAELLAFFMHRDRERWVAWTPSGYYDAAPGGEDLIGWHVNRGFDTEPAFFPASLFRDRFYRPDIVQEVLLTRDESEAVALANARRMQTSEASMVVAALPPVVRILSPVRAERLPRGSVMLELDVSASNDAPLTELQLRVNGRLQHGAVLSEAQPAGGDPESRILTIPVDLSGVEGSEAIITAQGVNRHGFGPPVDVTVELEAASNSFQEFRSDPRLYVLAIGVSEYRDPSLRLSYAAKDAADMAAMLVRQEGALYSEVHVRLITDENATVDNIRDGLFWLEDEVTANDSANIFIAGHGVNDSQGELHFLPHEADMSALRRTALPAADIVRTVQYLQGRVVYYMDTCHSGNLELVRRGAVSLDLNRHIQDLSAVETGAVVFSSAAGSQYALESPEWGNGAFTLAVLEGLAGAADLNGDGAVSLNELNLFVSDMVKRLTNNQQTPVLQKPSAIRDFPLALLD